MSLEQVIQEQTEAIKAQTIALNHVVVAISKALGAKPEVVPTVAPVKKAAATVKKPLSEKTEKEIISEVLEEEDALNEDLAEGSEVYTPLPKGQRDAAFYAKHVRPALKALGEGNHAGLVELMQSFGVTKGTEIDPNNWDALVSKAKLATPEEEY